MSAGRIWARRFFRECSPIWPLIFGLLKMSWSLLTSVPTWSICLFVPCSSPICEFSWERTFWLDWRFCERLFCPDCSDFWSDSVVLSCAAFSASSCCWSRPMAADCAAKSFLEAKIEVMSQTSSARATTMRTTSIVIRIDCIFYSLFEPD